MTNMTYFERLFITGLPFGQNAVGTEWSAYREYGGARLYDDLAVSKEGGMTVTHAQVDRSVDPYTCTPPALERTLNATGLDRDKAFELLGAPGDDGFPRRILLCPQGAFANQKLRAGAKYRQSPPLDDDQDPADVRSYSAYADLFAQMVLRWGPKKADDKERVYTVPGSSWISTDPGTGRGTVWAHQGGNEIMNYAWNNGRTLTEFEGGVCWAACWAAVEALLGAGHGAVLVGPSFLAATAEGAREFHLGFINGCEQLGVEPGFNWHLSFHRYHRNGNMGQLQNDQATEGASPESVDAFSLYRGIVEVCEEFGSLPPMLTETGWGDDPTDAGKKQRAPLQGGMSLSASVGALEIRNLLLAAAAGVEVVCTYHIADNYGTGWLNRMGKFHGHLRDYPGQEGAPRWSPKDSQKVISAWMEGHGKVLSPVSGPYGVSYVREDGCEYVKATFNGHPLWLCWADGGPKVITLEDGTEQAVTTIPRDLGIEPTGQVLPVEPPAPEPVEPPTTPAPQPEPTPEPEPPVNAGWLKLHDVSEGEIWFKPNTAEA